MAKLSSLATRAAWAFAVTALVLIALAAAAPVPFTPPFGAWTRLSPDPIVSPRGDRFESDGTFNPAVIKQGGKFVMLYRAQDHRAPHRLAMPPAMTGSISFAARNRC